MEWMRKGLLFTLGGSAYYGLELAWRGRSHRTMFVLGGLCFLALGRLDAGMPRRPVWRRLLAGSAVCTCGELIFGLLFNRDHSIWDYRGLALNCRGQICLCFSLIWLPVSGAAMWLYRKANSVMDRGGV